MIAIRERHYASGEVRLQADISGVSADGVAFRKRLQVPKTVSKSQATRWAEEQRRRLERGDHPATRRASLAAKREADERARAEAAEAATVAEACAWYVADGEGDHLAAATLDLRRRLCADHLIPVLGGRPVRDLGEADVGALKLRFRSTSVGYLSVVLRALRGVLAAAERRGVLSRVSIRLPRAAPSSAPRAYDGPAFERLVAAAREIGPQHVGAILLCGEAGLRRGEVLGLQVADVAGVAGVLRVERERVWSGGAEIVKAPKSNRARLVPLSPRTTAALRELAVGREPDAFLFRTVRDPEAPATEATIRALVAAVQRRAGLPIKGPHALRHTAASGMLAAGVDVRAVQSILGHSRLDTTATYLHADEAAIARAGQRVQEWREAGPVTSTAQPPRKAQRGRVKPRDPA